MRVAIEWQNVSFSITKNGETKRILRDCSGKVEPGQLVGVMGASGCGKSTLLNLIAGRKNILVVTDPGVGPSNLLAENSQTGQIYANGMTYDGHEFNAFGGFVQQDDVLLGSMTPRELFTFALLMRTNLSTVQIRLRVESLVSMLMLKDC